MMAICFYCSVQQSHSGAPIQNNMNVNAMIPPAAVSSAADSQQSFVICQPLDMPPSIPATQTSNVHSNDITYDYSIHKSISNDEIRTSSLLNQEQVRSVLSL